MWQSLVLQKVATSEIGRKTQTKTHKFLGTKQRIEKTSPIDGQLLSVMATVGAFQQNEQHLTSTGACTATQKADFT